MSNLKISQLPNFSGNTSGSWLIANNSGETTTYKIQRENFLSGYAPSSDLTALSSSIATTDLNQNNTIAGLATISSLDTLSGSIATTDLNQNNTIAGLATTSSLTALSSSIAITDLNQNNTIAGLATTSSLTALSSSIAVTDLSQNNRLTSIESVTGSFAPSGNYATTGSNNFVGNQTITGSVTITGSLNVSGSSTLSTNPSLNVVGNLRFTNPAGVTSYQNLIEFGSGSVAESGSFIQFNPAGNAGKGTLTIRTYQSGSSVDIGKIDTTNRLIGNTILTGSAAVTGALNITGSVQRPFNVQSSFSGSTIYSFGTGSLSANFIQNKSQGFSLLQLIGSGSNDQATVGLQNSVGYTDFARINKDTSISNYPTVTGGTSGSLYFTGFDKVISDSSLTITGSLVSSGSNAANALYGQVNILYSENNSNQLIAVNGINQLSGSNATGLGNRLIGNTEITGSLIVSNSLSINNNGSITNTNPGGYIASANFSGSTFSNVSGQMYIGTFITGSGGLIRIEPGLSDGLLNLNARTTTISGSIIQTGSVQGNVVPLTITSNTASLNLNNGNFFTLQLVSGSATHLNPSNIKPGQTVSILVNTTGSATMTFPSSVKQASGSAYIPTNSTGLDILTLISKDTSSLYLVNAKNFI